MRGWLFWGQEEGSKLKAPKTSGGVRTPVRLTIPPGIVMFLVCFTNEPRDRQEKFLFTLLTNNRI